MCAHKLLDRAGAIFVGLYWEAVTNPLEKNLGMHYFEMYIRHGKGYSLEDQTYTYNWVGIILGRGNRNQLVLRDNRSLLGCGYKKTDTPF